MAEPHVTTGATVAVAVTAAALGPHFATEWALIVVGGFLGGFLAATNAETVGLRATLIVLMRGMAAAVLFTGLVVLQVAKHYELPINLLLLPTAGLIGWQLDRLKDLALGFISRRTGGA